MSDLTAMAMKITHADWGFPGIVESGGTAAAFVADPGEEISQTIVDWIENFAPDQVGAGKYFPHPSPPSMI
jgi:hypothetical protein